MKPVIVFWALTLSVELVASVPFEKNVPTIQNLTPPGVTDEKANPPILPPQNGIQNTAPELHHQDVNNEAMNWHALQLNNNEYRQPEYYKKEAVVPNPPAAFNSTLKTNNKAFNHGNVVPNNEGPEVQAQQHSEQQLLSPDISQLELQKTGLALNLFQLPIPPQSKSTQGQQFLAPQVQLQNHQLQWQNQNIQHQVLNHRALESNILLQQITNDNIIVENNTQNIDNTGPRFNDVKVKQYSNNPILPIVAQNAPGVNENQPESISSIVRHEENIPTSQNPAAAGEVKIQTATCENSCALAVAKAQYAAASAANAAAGAANAAKVAAGAAAEAARAAAIAKIAAADAAAAATAVTSSNCAIYTKIPVYPASESSHSQTSTAGNASQLPPVQIPAIELQKPQLLTNTPIATVPSEVGNPSNSIIESISSVPTSIYSNPPTPGSTDTSETFISSTASELKVHNVINTDLIPQVIPEDLEVAPNTANHSVDFASSAATVAATAAAITVAENTVENPSTLLSTNSLIDDKTAAAAADAAASTIETRYTISSQPIASTSTDLSPAISPPTKSTTSSSTSSQSSAILEPVKPSSEIVVTPLAASPSTVLSPTVSILTNSTASTSTSCQTPATPESSNPSSQTLDTSQNASTSTASSSAISPPTKSTTSVSTSNQSSAIQESTKPSSGTAVISEIGTASSLEISLPTKSTTSAATSSKSSTILESAKPSPGTIVTQATSTTLLSPATSFPSIPAKSITTIRNNGPKEQLIAKIIAKAIQSFLAAASRRPPVTHDSVHSSSATVTAHSLASAATSADVTSTPKKSSESPKFTSGPIVATESNTENVSNPRVPSLATFDGEVVRNNDEIVEPLEDVK